MNAFAAAVLSAVLISSVLAGCASKPRDPRQLDEQQVAALAEVGSSKFGIVWSGKLTGAREQGVSAVTDGVTTLTTREGSRTFIIHNRKDYPPSEANGFKGSDEELKAIGIKFLIASGAREDEVAGVQVLQHFTQNGEKIGDGKEVRVDERRRSDRTLLIQRRVAGIDVVSSRLLLNANSAGRIAFMELSWPDFSSDILQRAAGLREIASRSDVAPRLEGAEVESVQLVLLHSPAVGFYNDMTAAIRVIYRPNSAQVGKKPVRYLNARGEDIALPRSVDLPRETPVKRAEKKQ